MLPQLLVLGGDTMPGPGVRGTGGVWGPEGRGVLGWPALRHLQETQRLLQQEAVSLRLPCHTARGWGVVLGSSAPSPHGLQPLAPHPMALQPPQPLGPHPTALWLPVPWSLSQGPPPQPPAPYSLVPSPTTAPGPGPAAPPQLHGPTAPEPAPQLERHSPSPGHRCGGQDLMPGQRGGGGCHGAEAEDPGVLPAPSQPGTQGCRG